VPDLLPLDLRVKLAICLIHLKHLKLAEVSWFGSQVYLENNDMCEIIYFSWTFNCVYFLCLTIHELSIQMK